MDRAMASDAMCRWFESGRGCQKDLLPFKSKRSFFIFFVIFVPEYGNGKKHYE